MSSLNCKVIRLSSNWFVSVNFKQSLAINMTREVDFNHYSPSQSEQDFKQQSAVSSVPGQVAQRLLKNIWEPLDACGSGLMGRELWMQVCEEIQEAIAFCLILKVPDLIGKLILPDQDFSDFKSCAKDGFLNVNSYACFTIVTSDLLFWVGIIARVIARFKEEFLSATRKIFSSKRFRRGG